MADSSCHYAFECQQAQRWVPYADRRVNAQLLIGFGGVSINVQYQGSQADTQAEIGKTGILDIPGLTVRLTTLLADDQLRPTESPSDHYQHPSTPTRIPCFMLEDGATLAAAHQVWSKEVPWRFCVLLAKCLVYVCPSILIFAEQFNTHEAIPLKLSLQIKGREKLLAEKSA